MIKLLQHLWGSEKNSVIFKFREDRISFDAPCEVFNQGDTFCWSISQHQARNLMEWLQKQLKEADATCDTCYDFKMPACYKGKIKCSACKRIIEK